MMECCELACLFFLKMFKNNAIVFHMKDINRFVHWPWEPSPFGASAWPKMAGILNSGGASRYDFTPDYFCPHAIVRGSGTLRTSRGEWPLEPGAMFTLWPGERFEYFERPGALWEYYWVHLDGPGAEELVRSCGFSLEHPWLKAPANPARAESLLHAIWSAMASRDGASSAVSSLYALPGACAGEAKAPAASPSLVDEAVGIMQALMHSGLNIKELAGHCGVGRVTLFRAFKARFGCGPSEYFDGLRIAKAKELLLCSGRSLESIALAVGFRDAPYFSRRFKAKEGICPRAFRKAGGFAQRSV